MSSDILKLKTKIKRTPRVIQLEGIFDVSKASESLVEIKKIPDSLGEWTIGLVVGHSGSGKTSIAREKWGDCIVDEYEWDADKSIVDSFDKSLTMREITGALSSVGFSSPPAWMRPYRVLSNGEKFRANMARALVDERELIVIDEFTSVVDRKVAKIASTAIQKAFRRKGKKLVAVSCHYDIVRWLEPDWVYEPATGTLARDRLQRPSIEITIQQVHRSAWQLFKNHHYLSTNINKAARCFVGYVWDQPAVFMAVLSFPHPRRSGWRDHRTVCLPDFQGAGIGNAMNAAICSTYRATGKPVFSTTSHPAMIYSRARSKNWKMTSKPRFAPRHKGIKQAGSSNRKTAGFEYVGESDRQSAKEFGLIKL
jgi:hypothetical protein